MTQPVLPPEAGPPIPRATSASPSAPSDSRFLLTLSREHSLWMTQVADTKANVLMAASAILAGLLVSHSIPVCNDPARAAGFLGIGLLFSAAGAALLTLLPRTKSEQHRTLFYYQTALAYEKWDDYWAMVRNLSASDVDSDLSGQAWELARILKRKYRWLRLGFLLFGLALPVTFIGLALAQLPCA